MSNDFRVRWISALRLALEVSTLTNQRSASSPIRLRRTWTIIVSG